MTMPATATYVKSLGANVQSAADMSAVQIEAALYTLETDLGHTPWTILSRVPDSISCNCGAVHLDLAEFSDQDSPHLKNMVRLLATPFGDIILRRIQQHHPDVTAVKFGWNGLEGFTPNFVETVDRLGVRSIKAEYMSTDELLEVVDAIRRDLPLAVEMMERSARNTLQRKTSGLVPFSISPMQDGSKDRWSERVFELMFAWSTPLKKYLNEWLSREYGVRGLAINCCMFPTEDIKRTKQSGLKPIEGGWGVQVEQQVTPDC